MNNNLKTRVCNENDKKHLPFLKSYKFLFQDKNYQALPYQSKAMYTNMANKQVRVLKSDAKDLYIDKNGKPFITYPIIELENDLKLSKSSVKKYKRILVEYGLITTTNNGKNIYVNKPKVSDNSLTYDNGKKLSYFHMPKFFETNPNYKNASLLTRLVYTLQKDRFTLTLANVTPKKSSSYIDERGRVFCIYANQELAKMLNVCEQSIIRAKNELEALGLLKQRQQGVNKPNRLYLYTPLRSEQLTTEAFLEETQTEENDKNYVLVPPEKSIGSRTYKRVEFKYEVDKGLNMKSNNTVINNTVLSNTLNTMYSMYSMYKVNTYVKDSNNTNNDLEQTKKEMKLTPYNFSNELTRYLMNFSSNDLSIVLKKLANAKNNYNKNYDTHFVLEDINDELFDMIKRVKAVIHEKNSSVSAMGGYIYQSTINEFKAYEIQKIEEKYDNSEETVEEFANRWDNKIKNVIQNLKNKNVESVAVKHEQNQLNVIKENQSITEVVNYHDELGIPY
ncbi:TPA: replication initiator protein A [Staphylococcus aureus]|nr:replication initiator protein A [Staphylococcus aureus]HDM3615752.1 replication initiator protein A [Staphylococcus aureus]HDM4013067.1 replication initiator protein A [Staphylococcus aureus]